MQLIFPVKKSEDEKLGPKNISREGRMGARVYPQPLQYFYINAHVAAAAWVTSISPTHFSFNKDTGVEPKWHQPVCRAGSATCLLADTSRSNSQSCPWFVKGLSILQRLFITARSFSLTPSYLHVGIFNSTFIRIISIISKQSTSNKNWKTDHLNTVHRINFNYVPSCWVYMLTFICRRLNLTLVCRCDAVYLGTQLF